MLEPRIEKIQEIRLVGKRLIMSLSNNRTKDLWQSFMPIRKQIINQAGPELYAVEIFENPDFTQNFNPSMEFEKWAAVKVDDFHSIPKAMESLVIPSGLYVVFRYKGKPSEAEVTYQYIYTNWIPNSGYSLDNRPHFAVMGEKYRGEDPDSEEELWFPIVQI